MAPLEVITVPDSFFRACDMQQARLVSVFASKAPCTTACGPVRRCCQAKRTGTCYDGGGSQQLQRWAAPTCSYSSEGQRFRRATLGLKPAAWACRASRKWLENTWLAYSSGGSHQLHVAYILLCTHATYLRLEHRLLGRGRVRSRQGGCLGFLLNCGCDGTGALARGQRGRVHCEAIADVRSCACMLQSGGRGCSLRDVAMASGSGRCAFRAFHSGTI